MNTKKLAVILLVALCVALPAQGWAKSDTEARIEKLEQQVQELKEQAKKEGGSIVKTKFPVELYGFVAAQFMWGTAETQLYGGINSYAASSRVTNKATIVDASDAWFGATPQNSRLGLFWSGTELEKNLSIGGKFEVDFVNILNSTTYGTSPMPRIRLLYLDLYGSKWSLVAGQHWDIFSPLNTRSLSLGNNVWFQGNMGFRRPQLRFTYKFLDGDVNKLKVAVSADHPANTDDMINNGGIDTAYPYGEMLVEYNRKMKYGDLVIAGSTVVGGNRAAGNKTRKTYGLCGSLAIPLHKFFQIDGEIHWGQNLGNLLTYAGTTTDARDVAGWAQVSSRWFEKFETNVGFGIDNAQRSKIATGSVNKNQIYFGNFKYYPVKPFYFGIEYEYLRTGYRGNGTSTASVIFSNLVYTF